MSTDLQVLEVHSSQEAEEMANFFKSIWTGGDDVVPFDLILAAAHVGGYAFLVRQKNKVVGASFGFRGVFQGENILHSHVTAASVPGVGLGIKMHQFEWAKDQGVSGITWTFDPLVRRNCVFNFEKLGAVAVEYQPNFYGTMTDSINFGDDSDRLLAFWSLHRQHAESKSENYETALRNVLGEPQIKSHDDSQPFWVELPEDIEEMRKTDLLLAQRWRSDLRKVVQPAIDDGAVIRLMKADRSAILVEPAIVGL